MLSTKCVKILWLLKFVMCQNIKRVRSIFLELQKCQKLMLHTNMKTQREIIRDLRDRHFHRIQRQTSRNQFVKMISFFYVIIEK